jgi:hypothetical protein
MPIQAGEIVVGDYQVWNTEPLIGNYLDIYRLYQTGTITNDESGWRVGIRNSAFDKEYDRYEIISSLFYRIDSYHCSGILTSGHPSTYYVKSFSSSYSPNETPARIAVPTLRIPALTVIDTSGNFASVQIDNLDSYPFVEKPLYPVVIFQHQFAKFLVPEVRARRWYAPNPVDDPTNLPQSNYSEIYEIPLIVRYYKRGNAPYYGDLLKGYSRDNRTIHSNPLIVPSVSNAVDITYHRQNKFESIPNLESIDLMTYTVDLVAGAAMPLPITDCVLGTLIINNQDLKNQLIATGAPNGKYPYKYYFQEYLSELFALWYQQSTIPTNNNMLRIIGANNNHWNNRPIPTADLNFDITHPMFAIDNQRAYDWHIKPQSDGSYGDLVMDSPRTIEIRLMIEQLLTALNALQYQVEIPAIIGTGTVENPETPAKHKLDWYIKNSQGSGIPAAIITKITEIWKALGGAKYANNQLDNTKDRVTNLGFLTERIAKVLGIRFDDNGKIEVDKEKAIVRKVIDGTKNVDPEKVGINGFGDGGMVVKRINNRFKNKGEIVSDQCVVVQDMPDLIQEYFEQANLALGIQESSAIEIKQDGTAARFNSQLEVLIELVNLMSSGNEMTRAALVSSLVTQSQTNELIAGLGLPSVTKTIPIKIGKKVSQVPFKGIAAHRSIAQEVATCTYNVGIVLGQVL